MKKLSEAREGLIFKNYNLTDLMLLKKNGRKNRSNENSALNELLSQKLEEYGLQLLGQFEENNLTFRCVRMFEDFPVENEEILRQLYGFENFTAHIQLRGFDNYATAFNYNTTTGECELQRHCWGSVTHRIKYTTLKGLLEDINKRSYDEIFGL